MFCHSLKLPAAFAESLKDFCTAAILDRPAAAASPPVGGERAGGAWQAKQAELVAHLRERATFVQQQYATGHAPDSDQLRRFLAKLGASVKAGLGPDPTAALKAAVVATFAVREGDGVMLMTDGGRLIRLPADQIRITGRGAMGVTLLRLGESERVTSCFPVVEEVEVNGDPGPDPVSDPDGDGMDETGAGDAGDV